MIKVASFLVRLRSAIVAVVVFASFYFGSFIVLQPPDGVVQNSTNRVVVSSSSSSSASLSSTLEEEVVTTTAAAETETAQPPLWEEVAFDANRTCLGFNETWCFDARGTIRYVDQAHHTHYKKAFTLPYRTHAGVEHCLANKHVLFMGDSRVRYQLLDLVDFLQHGVWMQCQDEKMLAAQYPNVTTATPTATATSANRFLNSTTTRFSISPSCYLLDHEHHKRNMQTNDWDDWYSNTTDMLRQEGVQESVCDCYRRSPFRPPSTVENRYFRRRTRYGTIRLTYLQTFDNRFQIHLNQFNSSNPFDNTTQRCLPGNCSQPYTPFTIPQQFSNVLPPYEPTHVVALSGWILRDMSCQLQAYAQAHPGVTVLAQNHPAERKHQTPPPVPPLQCNNISFVDRQTMTAGIPPFFYWDKLHVLSAANRELNAKLLDHLCGGPLVQTV